MENKNTIGCSAGRAKIVDPNDFDGFKSSDNVPVQLEDLNISVKLTSFRKGRTLLTGESEGGIKDNVSEISVNFIEGSEMGNKKVLTTSYTDLTTSFESDIVNDETLGITNIDIEFNASMAPMITINFIDVRGSAIFQNEENILNNRGNKYTTFFQLPYPIFELEIKGYYGMPVKYCLHMLKFNSKFNSQTGNFEITANFIGYTFALMSDMLIGYLKAIPFTTIGEQQFNKYNETFTNGNKVLTLSELSIAISQLNEGIQKQANENPAAKELNAVDDSTEYLDLIRGQIIQLGQSFDLNPTKDDYQYIVYNSSDTYTDAQKNALENQYKVKVKEFIDKFNELNAENKLIDSDFLNIENTTNTNGGKLYKNVTLEELNSKDANPSLALKLGNPSDFSGEKQKIVKFINSKNADPKIGDKANINIFDMSLLYDIIGKIRKSLEVTGKEAKVKLAKAFENEVREIIGFDPTARTIIECYTAAIETFIETIFLVSEAASKNTERTDELAKKFIDDEEVNKITDMTNVFIKKQEFFPWPDYREKDAEKQTYVDKYLGAADVLENPEKVDELVFIDDLLQAFRKAAKAEQAAVEAQEVNETTWNSVNPYDTAIFSDIEPYERAGDLTTMADVVRLMVIRAMVFLGYSNDPSILSDEEIIGMGVAEVNNMLRGVKDSVIRQALTQVSLKFIQEISGTINSDDRKVLAEDGNDLYYNYIYKSGGKDGFKVLPLNKGFNNEFWGDPNTNAKIKEDLVSKRDDGEYYFLTNYSDAKNFKKLDDGGLDIKILDSLPTPATIATIPEGVPTETKMILSELTSAIPTSAAGYNSFNPNYGIQEYKDMDWGNADLDGLPLMYVFYRNCDNGLALTRAESGNVQSLKFDTSSPFFYNVYKTIKWPDSKEEAYETGVIESGKKRMTGKKMHIGLGQNRELFQGILNAGSGSSITYPYVELKFGIPNTDWTGFVTLDEPRNAYEDNSFSLFGSNFYYNQSYAEIVKSNNTKISCSDYSRASLFLQTFPFNTDQKTANPFGKNEIKHLFDMKAGIIHAPRMWCAYIGSMLWRIDTSNPVLDDEGQMIGGGSGKNDPIVWSINYTNGEVNKSVINNAGIITFDKNRQIFDIPGKLDEYFPTFLDYTKGFLGDLTIVSYPDIYDINTIKTLPEQVKNEFKRMFFEFVNGTGGKVSWKSLADKLEIYDTSLVNSGKSFSKYLEAVRALDDENTSSDKIVTGNLTGGPYNTKETNIRTYYDIITPIDDSLLKASSVHDFYLFLELKDGYGKNQAVTSIIDAMNDEVFIINNNYKIWKGGESLVTTERESISVDKTKFDTYFESVINVLSGKTDEYNISKQNENLDISVFGTANKDIIRLQLYRNCKNIYDKWLGGAKDVDHLVFQCGGGRSSVDAALAKKYDNTKTRMIDSFRFVTRNFRDIGNELYINPIPLNDMLIGNPNSSAYDGISSILASNNFNFQALPNFINFNDDKNLEAIFKPYNYSKDLLTEGSCGPAFVCVYDGQSSKHLELKDGNYPNDGFDLRCMNGGVDVSVPTDFTSEKYADYEDPISTFMVRYSQQNQNIFKDINLDQSEFSETDESIQIQDEISQKGSENNRSIVGQNIYNVYAVRSYTAKVEMMGNAMIQPMMYFQLDNIPMFHGAYLITKVSHSLKPNSMSTNFTGTRIRYPETPLVTAYDVYMDLLETLDLSDAGTGQVGGGGGSTGVSGTFKPIVATIIENGVINGNANGAGNIKFTKVPDITGISFQNSRKDERIMLDEAVKPLVKMLTDWVAWMSSNGFKAVGAGGSYAYITSMYRTLQHQQELSGKGGAAKAGRSNHGWGIAVDLQMFNKKGVIFGNNNSTGSPKSFFNFDTNPAYGWLMKNSYKYGFVNPYSLRDGKGVDEHWHFEYHGTSAKCLLEEHTTVYGQNVKVDGDYIKDLVINPKTKDGKVAVYTDCKGKDVSTEGDSLTEAGCPATSAKKPFTKQSGYKNTIEKIINGTYTCSAGRDCKGSFDGLKQVPAFWSNNKLTKKGIVAMAFGITEGFGSGKNCKNPGNLRGTGCNGFEKFASWKAGWEAYNTQTLVAWSNGTVPATASAKYPDCYKTETNKILKESGVKYQELTTYNYKKGSKPSLRQFINIYAPWGDLNNPSNYIASVATTLKAYGYDIDVDAPMSTWL